MLRTTALAQRQKHSLKSLAQSKKYSLELICWIAAIILGAIQAWANRYHLSTDDAVSYLDIGDAYLRGDWKVAINGYWSPLYSWLLGVALFILKPSPYWEFAVVKLVNFLIYLSALASFSFFLQELICYYQKNVVKEPKNKYFIIPQWVWLVLGYTLFIWSSLKWISLGSDTPDMCTAALLYLAAGIMLRVHSSSEGWLNFIILGAALGLSYLSKAVMFPLAFVFLGVCLFLLSNLRRALPRVLVAFLVFTIVSAPFIGALSIAKGRFTYGDTGNLNYVWNVTGGMVRFRHWQGTEPGSGIPKHPTRVIFDNPRIYEFAAPIDGTYSPWLDPSYWYEGMKFRFSLGNQLKVLARNAIFYYEYFLGCLIFGYLILVGGNRKLKLLLQDLKANWFLLIPSVAGLGIYIIGTDLQDAMIEGQPSTRYIAVFIVLLFAGVFASVRLPNSQASKRLIASLTLATLIIVGSQLAYPLSKDFSAAVHKQASFVDFQVAKTLNQLGVRSGDKIAILGEYMFPAYHWARLARVKIVAEVFDQKSFWEADEAVRLQALKTIEETGAKAIVQKPGLTLPNTITATGWQKIDDTDYYAYLFKSK